MYKFVVLHKAALRLAHVVSSSSGCSVELPEPDVDASAGHVLFGSAFIKNAMQSTLQVNNSRADLGAHTLAEEQKRKLEEEEA